jgi:sRNA-binding protein
MIDEPQDSAPSGAAAAPGPQPAAPESVPEVQTAPEAQETPTTATASGAGETAAPPTAAEPMSPAACGARLVELFPALFVAPGSPEAVKAIKLRIHADIQARAPGLFSKRTLGLFFSRYTTTNAYLKALANAPHRFDLDGQPAGEIAEEHRAAAVEELARRRALHEARRAAEREANFARQREARRVQADAAGVQAPLAPGAARRPPQANDGRPPKPRRDRPPQARPQPRLPDPSARGHVETAPAPRSEPAPEDAARRERALLLRAFEDSPLAKANFCVLKRIDEATLDAALAQARQERAERGMAAPAQRPERTQDAQQRARDRQPAPRRG